MNSMSQIFLFFFNSIRAFFGFKGDRDPTVALPPARVADQQEIVPLDRTKVPFLGPEHEGLIKKAEQLYSDDVNRIKWLKAVLRLKDTTTGWILDPKPDTRHMLSWGIPGTAAIPM